MIAGLLMWWTGTRGPAAYNGRGMDWGGGWYVATRLLLPIVLAVVLGTPENIAAWLLGLTAYYITFFAVGALLDAKGGVS